MRIGFSPRGRRLLLLRTRSADERQDDESGDESHPTSRNAGETTTENGRVNPGLA
jgi:hypothetical protein